MARRAAKANDKKAEAEAPQADADQPTHLYLSPTGEVHELTDEEFLGDKQMRGFVRAGDVAQDHLEDVEPAEEQEPPAGEIELPETNLEPDASKSDEPNSEQRPQAPDDTTKAEDKVEDKDK